MNSFSRQLWAFIMILSLGLSSMTAFADDDDEDRRGPTVLDTLVRTDGAQAVVAAVLVVDETLDAGLADLLGNKRAELVVFAPSNAAFEDLLMLPDGFLNGLSIEQVVDALPGAVAAAGLTVDDVAAVLAKHVAVLRRANLRTASDFALLRKGAVQVSDGSVFPVGVGGSGVQVNYETTIIKPNLRGVNGVVHFIDTVILDAP